MTRRQSTRIRGKTAIGSGEEKTDLSDARVDSSPLTMAQTAITITDEEPHQAFNPVSDPESDSETVGAELFVIDTKPSGASSMSSHLKGHESDSDSSDSDSESDDEAVETKGSAESAGLELSSSLQPGIGFEDTYLNINAYKSPSLYNKKMDKLLASKSKEKELLQKSVFKPNVEKLDALPPYRESMNQLKKQRRKERSQTKGSGWFDMKAPEMTEEKKNEIHVLQMRRSLDPKRFYKAADIHGMPKFFQTARIVDGPADFYNRVPKKDRKRTLVDELMADAEFKKFSKRKFAEIQESKKHHKAKGAFKRMKRMKKTKK